jgi:hypothetical protein
MSVSGQKNCGGLLPTLAIGESMRVQVLDDAPGDARQSVNRVRS